MDGGRGGHHAGPLRPWRGRDRHLRPLWPVRRAALAAPDGRGHRASARAHRPRFQPGGGARGRSVAGAALLGPHARGGRRAAFRTGRRVDAHLLDLLAMARDGMGPGLAATIEEYGAARPSDALVLLTPALPPDLLDLCARLRRLGCGVAAVLLDAGSFGGALVPPDEAWLETE